MKEQSPQVLALISGINHQESAQGPYPVGGTDAPDMALLDAYSRAVTGVVDAVGPDVGTFYDNVWSVLREGGEMRVTPDQVREVMRVIEEVRVGTGFSGAVA